MKRFHVHLSVENLEHSINFYSKLFGAAPTRQACDYAKWMLEDPRINFAISTRSDKIGLDHLGFQADSDEELNDMKTLAKAADMALINEGETSCCYAASDKYWLTDPQGIAWEQFHTLANIPVFSEKQATAAGACCAPSTAPAETSAPPRGKALSIPIKGSCC